jgi:hypothetical protein
VRRLRASGDERRSGPSPLRWPGPCPYGPKVRWEYRRADHRVWPTRNGNVGQRRTSLPNGPAAGRARSGYREGDGHPPLKGRTLVASALSRFCTQHHEVSPLHRARQDADSISSLTASDFDVLLKRPDAQKYSCRGFRFLLRPGATAGLDVPFRGGKEGPLSSRGHQVEVSLEVHRPRPSTRGGRFLCG